MGEPTLEKARLLVVEDEADLRTSLSYTLRSHGYDLRAADSGHAALSTIETFTPDLVLLDIMLPDISGLEVCRKLRASMAPKSPAIIMLSARADEIDRVVGFEVGADDYVSKPFSTRELLLRIEARLRERAETTRPQPSQTPDRGASFALGALHVDELAHRVFVDGKEIHVSALEMRMLVYLFRAPGRMRTRRELLTEVWGYHPEVASRTVDTHIKRLRDKLGLAAPLLQTVRGVGFRLAEPQQE